MPQRTIHCCRCKDYHIREKGLKKECIGVTNPCFAITHRLADACDVGCRIYIISKGTKCLGGKTGGLSVCGSCSDRNGS